MTEPTMGMKTEAEINAIPPGQPVFTFGEDGPVAFQATCPRCGRVWDVIPRDDCFWPGCGHYDDHSTHADGTVHVCCESCGMQHAFACRREGSGQ